MSMKRLLLIILMFVLITNVIAQNIDLFNTSSDLINEGWEYESSNIGKLFFIGIIVFIVILILFILISILYELMNKKNELNKKTKKKVLRREK